MAYNNLLSLSPLSAACSVTSLGESQCVVLEDDTDIAGTSETLSKEWSHHETTKVGPKLPRAIRLCHTLGATAFHHVKKQTRERYVRLIIMNPSGSKSHA